MLTPVMLHGCVIVQGGGQLVMLKAQVLGMYIHEQLRDCPFLVALGAAAGVGFLFCSQFYDFGGLADGLGWLPARQPSLSACQPHVAAMGLDLSGGYAPNQPA